MLKAQTLHLRGRTVRLYTATAGVDAPAILMLPGFIQNRFAFEVPTHSLVDFLQKLGLTVHVLELHGRHRRLPGKRRDAITDYVEDDVEPVLEMLLGRHRRLAFLGHSMGGLLGVACSTALTSRLAAMVTIGSPMLPGVHTPGIDLPNVVMPWRRALNAMGSRLARRLHRVGAPFPGVQAGRALSALRPALDAPYARFPFQIWSPGSFHPGDLDAYLLSSFSEDSFGAAADLLELGRTRGTKGGSIDFEARLADLRAPLLVVGGNMDGLAPPSSVRVLYERAGSKDRSLVLVGDRARGEHFGHVDLLVGRLAPLRVWPALEHFLVPRLAATR